MKKLFITSAIAILASLPAFAESFPSNGYMLENKTYDNAATSTNMAGVYEDSVNADANYDNCPAGYWCDASGQHACSSLSGGYNSSDAGSTENTACYKSCTVATANIAHATAVTGNDYYGAGTDTCSATSCENGYHINGGIGTVAGGYANNNKYGYISNNGTNTRNQSTYGLTENGTFALEYANNKGMIKGRAACSNEGPANPWYDDANYTFSEGNIVSLLPYNSTGQYCYCTVDEYTPVDGAPMSLSGPWVFANDDGSASVCARNCADDCVYFLGGDTRSDSLAFRSAILGSLYDLAATCAANVITINWSGASAADIAANEAGTVTYGGDIRTPRAAEIIPGKVFTGWTFRAPVLVGPAR